MNLNLAKLNRNLIAAARANPPSDQEPYAFEKRIIARLKAPVALDDWALWSRALWRAAAPCVAIMLPLTAWSVFAPAGRASATDWSQDFENSLPASAGP